MELVEGTDGVGAAGAGQPFHRGRALRWPLVVERAYKYDIAPLLYRNLEILDFPGALIQHHERLGQTHHVQQPARR